MINSGREWDWMDDREVDNQKRKYFCKGGLYPKIRAREKADNKFNYTLKNRLPIINKQDEDTDGSNG